MSEWASGLNCRDPTAVVVPADKLAPGRSTECAEQYDTLSVPHYLSLALSVPYYLSLALNARYYLSLCA